MLPEEWNIAVTRSRRRTVSLSVQSGKRVTVKAPYGVSDREIQNILEEKQGWIHRQMERLSRIEEESVSEGYLTIEELQKLAEKAAGILPARVKWYAERIGVTYGRITIRNQKTCWGSCSAKGNLNFNCLLMLTPPEIADYVVVHELCHRLEMNHSRRFWELVERELPDYKERRRWLKEHGPAIMGRMLADRQ